MKDMIKSFMRWLPDILCIYLLSPLSLLARLLILSLGLVSFFSSLLLPRSYTKLRFLSDSLLTVLYLPYFLIKSLVFLPISYFLPNILTNFYLRCSLSPTYGISTISKWLFKKMGFGPRDVHIEQITQCIRNSALQANLEDIKWLKSLGFDLSLQDAHGKDALMYASEKGHKDVVEYLIEQGVDMERSYIDLAFLERFVSLRPVVFNIQAVFTHLAAHNLANRLRNDNITLGSTAFALAIKNENTDVVKIFLEKGVKFDSIFVSKEDLSSHKRANELTENQEIKDIIKDWGDNVSTLKTYLETATDEWISQQERQDIYNKFPKRFLKIVIQENNHILSPVQKERLNLILNREIRKNTRNKIRDLGNDQCINLVPLNDGKRPLPLELQGKILDYLSVKDTLNVVKAVSKAKPS